MQQSGQRLHLWRVVGEYANCSVFDVASNDELHNALSELALLSYLAITVALLARQPSLIK